MVQLLTRSQQEILQHRADGLDTIEIASTLGLKVSTIRSHLNAAYRNLGANCCANAVAIALRAGVIR